MGLMLIREENRNDALLQLIVYLSLIREKDNVFGHILALLQIRHNFMPAVKFLVTVLLLSNTALIAGSNGAYAIVLLQPKAKGLISFSIREWNKIELKIAESLNFVLKRFLFWWWLTSYCSYGFC